MQGVNVFPDIERSDLYHIMRAFGGSLKKWQVIPYVLRLEQVLLPSQKQYIFDFNKGSGRSTEILLSRNDMLFARYIGFTVGRRSATEGSGGLSVDNYPKYTYPDAKQFDGAAVGGATEAQSLWPLWGGKMNVKTDTKDRLMDWSCMEFLWVPENPYRNGNVLTAPNGADQTFDPAYWNMYGYEPEQKGLRRLCPAIGFDGQQNNSAIISLPDDALIGNINGDTNAAGTSGQGNLNILTLWVCGYNIVQGADPVLRKSLQ